MLKCLVVVMVPVALLMEIIVARGVMIVVAMPVVSAGMVVVVAGVMPSVPAAPIATVVSTVVVAIVTVVASIVSTIPAAMRITDIDMNSSRPKVNALSFRFTRLASPTACNQQGRTQ
jgi:hypothetical protein